MKALVLMFFAGVCAAQTAPVRLDHELEPWKGDFDGML